VRLCHLRKLNTSTEYGFNIKSKNDFDCQYIGIVDEGTPAELAGLRSGDKIIEINNLNASNLKYQELIKIAKSGFNNNPNELLLLVVDQSTDNFYKTLNASQKDNMVSQAVPYFFNQNGKHYSEEEEEQEIEIKIPSSATSSLSNFNVYTSNNTASNYNSNRYNHFNTYNNSNNNNNRFNDEEITFI
jgi:hypothetical protein